MDWPHIYNPLTNSQISNKPFIDGKTTLLGLYTLHSGASLQISTDLKGYQVEPTKRGDFFGSANSEAELALRAAYKAVSHMVTRCNNDFLKFWMDLDMTYDNREVRDLNNRWSRVCSKYKASLVQEEGII